MKLSNEVRPANRRRWGRYLLTAVVLALLAIGWLWHGRAGKTAAESVASAPALLELAPTDLVTARSGEVIEGVQFTGTLQAVNQAALAAPIEGRIAEVMVRAGESVSKGQVMARLDLSDLEARLAEQRAALADARAQLQVAERAEERQQTLFKQNFISKNALDEVASTLSARRAEVTARQGALDIAARSLRDATVRSPIDGVVASRDVEPGQEVANKAKLFTVVDLTQLELQAELPPARVGKVRIGSTATLKAEGIDHPVPASVVRINPVAQSGTRTIPVYLRIDNPDGLLRVGLFAEGRLETGRRSGLLVPKQAVLGEGAARHVWVVRGDRLVSVPVKPLEGEAGEEETALQPGGELKAGERVVTAALANPKPGQRVKLLAR